MTTLLEGTDKDSLELAIQEFEIGIQHTHDTSTPIIQVIPMHDLYVGQAPTVCNTWVIWLATITSTLR